MSKQYIIDNLSSEYFGITATELETYKDKKNNITWVKLVFDYVSQYSSIEERQTWFKLSELEEVL